MNVEVFRRGRFAGADSVWRPYTPEERAMLSESVRSYYRLFVQRVSESRHMPAARVDALGRGRVYSGERARELGLVDRLGGLAAALERARELGGLPPDAPAGVYPERKPSLMSCLVEQALGNAESGEAAPAGAALRLRLPRELGALLGLLLPYYQAQGGKPLALMPYLLRIEL